MKHARLHTPEGSVIVRADGTVPQPWDASRPVLHLLPKLLLGSGVLHACPHPRVSCMATVLSPSGIILPGHLVVRQPLPSRRFLVAGTDDSRYGFLVPLPPDLPGEVVIRFSWRFADAVQADVVWRQGVEDAIGVDHVLRLRLRPSGHGQVFSMDTSAWPDRDAGAPSPCHTQPFAVLSKEGLPCARKRSVELELDPSTDVLAMDERLDVPGILLSDVWGFAEFEEEQLHEVGQTAAFDPASPATLAHRANACVEMPASVLVEAVRFARNVPYDEGTAYHGSMAATERHPALLALCGWWNANAPEPLHRRAGLCMPWVRVSDEGDYWCAHYEVPNMSVDQPPCWPEAAARVGDVALIEFGQGLRAATFNPDLELWDVTGRLRCSVGVGEDEVRSGKCDEGWHTLEALACFPERFPAAWAWLVKCSPDSQDEWDEGQFGADPDAGDVESWGDSEPAPAAFARMGSLQATGTTTGTRLTRLLFRFWCRLDQWRSRMSVTRRS